MAVDKNDFFRHATLQICGSLDIETSLWRCLQYLETIIPVTGMNLSLLEEDLSGIRVIAHVTRYELEKLDRFIPLSIDARTWIARDWLKMKDVRIFNHLETNPFMKSMAKHTRKFEASTMLMRLEMEGKKLGILTLIADGRNRYRYEHAELLSLLHDPFAVAMSNARRYEELQLFRDMLADDNKYLNKELLRLSGDEIIGEHKGLREVKAKVLRVAPLDSPVLLLGETGVGKEVVANAIHNHSSRSGGPFIKVNCGAIPESLIDTELFGHEKGAFTGAVKVKRGRFERAHKGTILLDEVGELTPQAQVRLLRVLQNKEIERVGATKPISVDIRVLAATHRDLEEMVIARRFREDLWFRLNVVPIVIPPLRERKEDIPLLVDYFIEKKSKELRMPCKPGLAAGAMDALIDLHWQGNVRELENVVERALIQHLGMGEKALLTFDATVLPGNEMNSKNMARKKNKILSIDEIMSLHIREALKNTNGKVHGKGGAAELLGINPSTLRNRMNRLGINYKKRK